jgi:hypothetical protein
VIPRAGHLDVIGAAILGDLANLRVGPRRRVFRRRLSRLGDGAVVAAVVVGDDLDIAIPTDPQQHNSSRPPTTPRVIHNLRRDFLGGVVGWSGCESGEVIGFPWRKWRVVSGRYPTDRGWPRRVAGGTARTCQDVSHRSPPPTPTHPTASRGMSLNTGSRLASLLRQPRGTCRRALGRRQPAGTAIWRLGCVCAALFAMNGSCGVLRAVCWTMRAGSRPDHHGRRTERAVRTTTVRQGAPR